MEYIVLDTEFSQPQPKLYNPNSRFRPNPVSPFEIIEIGAVKVNEDLEITSTFNRLIKPVIYHRLSPIVMRKTGIRLQDLKSGDDFRKAIIDFQRFCGDDYILCTWSTNDIRILKKNCIYHKLPYNWAERYCDIQSICTKILGLPKSQAIGLKNALSAFGINVEGKLHRALDDAHNTARLLIKIFNEDIKEQINNNK